MSVCNRVILISSVWRTRRLRKSPCRGAQGTQSLSAQDRRSPAQESRGCHIRTLLDSTQTYSQHASPLKSLLDFKALLLSKSSCPKAWDSRAGLREAPSEVDQHSRRNQ